MEYYRIGEFARRCGTTVEFLKFYDREGLVCPVWRDDAGYRYYADYQMVHFAELYKLSRLGFSTKEAKYIHDGCTLEELAALLSQRQQALQAEISEQQFALSYLNDLLTAAEHIQQQNRWYIIPLPDAVFSAKPKHLHSALGKPWWKATPHLPEIWQRVELIHPDNGHAQLDPQTRVWGTLLTDMSQEANPDSAMSVPKCRCFQYWHSIPAEYEEPSHRLSDNVWDLAEPLSIMFQHNLVPRGDLYQRRLFVTREHGEAFVHTMTLIPLK